MQGIDSIIRVLGLSEEEKKLLISLRFYPGQYAEILAMNEDVGKGVIILNPSPIMRWMFTTHKDERYLREKLVETICREKAMAGRKAQAIVVQALAQFHPDGAIGTDINVDETAKKLESLGYLS